MIGLERVSLFIFLRKTDKKWMVFSSFLGLSQLDAEREEIEAFCELYSHTVNKKHRFRQSYAPSEEVLSLLLLSMPHTLAEYIWLDGSVPTASLRSKTKVINCSVQQLKDIPEWGFDGSSTQ